MSDSPQVLLSGFADEAANEKTIVQQFTAFAALGLSYYTVRFIDVGSGIKNVMQLTAPEVKQVVKLQQEYGLRVATLGSPIGKVKLHDVEDGTNNRYVPFKKYLGSDVKKACDLAGKLGTKLIRGFSFYHPKGDDPASHLPEVVDRLGAIVDECERHELVFGLEIEANLVGQSGDLLAEIHRQVKHDRLVLIFDAANIVCQGCSMEEVFRQYRVMKPGLGWMHIKDYRHPEPMGRVTHVDEETLKHFVPSDLGDSGHEAILRDFAQDLPKYDRRMRKLGAPGVFLDLEPHVKGGGQFGGFSGPDGFGVALRGLMRLLDYVNVDYKLRDFDDILRSRGLK
ncbi:MAG: sugar phosphate isomerase/epimerase [Planctomycetales bacterium]|nr:sugar phosphate isomerase/epimerase [Planctomycetales bacterium]